MDLLGNEYIIDFVISEHKNNDIQLTYMIYTSRILSVLAESWGASIEREFYEIISSDTHDEKTADEIALEVIKRAGLKGK